ncbi:MAG: DNA-cytosine methyltransferase [Hydrogenibacillus schlegelii]|uniref:DNA (cytosine-5-)-methyltransferase n=1 Tax=Hydrogenibacillus schlegelii TaxID=1484 RepID=A0A2T5G5C0_HYDSH|nr:MAG: DNA-cytosine methyltransferase [Hydrogenibacillus schlegelii]
MIDLFSGSGGVTLGFKNRGFRVLAAVEIDPVAAETYRLNHPEVILFERDVRTVDPSEMMDVCGLRPGELTVLSVCAPCQPFSVQNRSKKEDPRVTLILEALRFVRSMKPEFVFFENVPGLYRGRYRDVLEELIRGLEYEGYGISGPKVVDAADYGVPQFRKRLIMLAASGGRVLPFPEPTHASPETARQTGKKPWRTVREAFRGLPPLRSGEKDENDPLHRARKHRPVAMERLKYIPKDGGSRHSLPSHLQLSCHVGDGNLGFHDVYGRMEYDRPSNTLTTGCTNLTKGRFAHPEQDRAITPREAARLQTFPDDYRFAGSYEQISAQIGNAVPVLLAEVFAQTFREHSKDRSGRSESCGEANEYAGSAKCR